MGSGLSFQELILRDFWNLADFVYKKATQKPHDDLFLGEVCAGDIGVAEYAQHPKMLYHYTSRNAAVDILSKSDANSKCGLGFTDYRFLNDDREFRLGVDVARIWMRTYSKSIRGDLKEKILTLLGYKSENQKYAPYVLSFSQHGDSTVHWAAYSDKKDGGYALGFSYREVGKAVARYNADMRERDVDESLRAVSIPIFMGPCIYCSVKELRLWKKSKRLPEKVVNLIAALLPNIEMVIYKNEVLYRDNLDRLAKWMAERLFIFASLVKSDEFMFENEWRLVLRKDHQPDGNVKIIAGKPRIVPSSLKLNDCLKEIVVSPHGDSPRLKMLASILANQNSRKVRVRTSDSSYNGR